jgi:succinate-acetate transporter protein
MSSEQLKGNFEHHEIIEETHKQIPYSQVQISEEYVIMDNKKFLKSDLMKAFGGQMNPGWAVPSIHKFGNPAPLGLSAFAFCTFVTSLIDCGAKGIKNEQVITGAAMFYGGFIQFVAGLWEISLENAFGGLAFCSFGGYWMASASFHIPWFNSTASYTTVQELNNAMGLYYLGWVMLTIILVACTIKSTVLFFTLFILVFLRLLMLSLSRFYDSEHILKAAGVFGVLAAVLAWYHAYAGLATKQNSYYVVESVPMPILPRKKKEYSDTTSSDLEGSSV